MKKIILALTVLFSTHAMAYQVTETKIKTINVGQTTIVIGTINTHANADACAHSASASTLILPLTDSTKAMYSALLSAQISGKNARLLYDGCIGTLPAVIRVDIVQ